MIEAIGKGLYLVHGANQGRFPWSHSIVAAGDSAVLFDTGCGADAIAEVEACFSIDLVVNSHTHPDHFAGNHLLPGRDLLVPSMFAGIITDMDKMSIRLAGGGAAAEEWKALVLETLGHEPTEPTRIYDEGDLIEVSWMKFRAIHTPGHLADHFCFMEENSGVLLSFDIDLTSFGPWYGHDECDLDDFCASLRKILKLRPEMIVSSHRRPITHDIPDEIAAFDAIFRERNEKILKMLNGATFKPEALADLSPIYGLERHTSALFHYFESRMVEKHLELLARRGLVTQEKNGAFTGAR